MALAEETILTQTALRVGSGRQVCSGGNWSQVQRALNTKMRVVTNRQLKVDGKKCCGKMANGHYAGETENAIVYWLGFTGIKNAIQGRYQDERMAALIAAIVNKSANDMTYFPEPDAVAKIQGQIGVPVNGCLDARTKLELDARFGGEWYLLSMGKLSERLTTTTDKTPPTKPTKKLAGAAAIAIGAAAAFWFISK